MSQWIFSVDLFNFLFIDKTEWFPFLLFSYWFTHFYWLSMGVIMEKRRGGGGKYITDENNNNASFSVSLSPFLFFSLRALIPCPAKHWANVELFRSLVRSMTRRAHLHLCCFSSIMNIEIGCHSIFNKKKQKKRFIRLFLSKYSF